MSDLACSAGPAPHRISVEPLGRRKRLSDLRPLSPPPRQGDVPGYSLILGHWTSRTEEPLTRITR
eukprot:3121521-Pyramimonas_sp.AAC.1